MEGNFLELGPNFLRKNLTTNKYEEVPRVVSWNDNYHLLFVDQPVGTGLSYIADDNDYVTSQDQVAANFYTALTRFFQLNDYQ